MSHHEHDHRRGHDHPAHHPRRRVVVDGIEHDTGARAHGRGRGRPGSAGEPAARPFGAEPFTGFGRGRHGGPGEHVRHGERGRGGWGRARRGDTRAAVLLLLAEQPRNGYQIIQELAERTADAWRPSPGSVYPVLAQLQDEELIESTQDGGGKSFQLSEAGRSYVESHRDELGNPWEDATGGMPSGHLELRRAVRQLLSAAHEVGSTGDAAMLAEAARQIQQARRALYLLLAGEGAGAPATGAAAGAGNTPSAHAGPEGPA